MSVVGFDDLSAARWLAPELAPERNTVLSRCERWWRRRAACFEVDGSCATSDVVPAGTAAPPASSGKE